MADADAAPGGGRVGVIGLGSMGTGMAARLLERGYRVISWNRTAGKSAALAAQGAAPASSPAEVAAHSEAILISLADEDAVWQVVFGPSGLASSLRPGTVVIETSTVSPEFARNFTARLGQAGHQALEARLLGNAQHAAAGELRVMAGGDHGAFERARPLLAALGKEVTYLGSSGTAATMKLVLNMLMGMEMQALAEAIILGEAAGLPRQAVIQAIAASGFSSPVMRFKCGVMGRGAYRPADFRLALMHKDLALVRSEAQRMQVLLPGADAAYGVLTAALRRGMGGLDCAAVLQFMQESLGTSEPGRPEPPPAG
ncbi:MAG TPA: NAD(P)-dependent oxidoreductase [Streptosporangiaceae bacterium]|jgi:3-hydroxyisobutyrate dehydrogenase